MDERDEQRLLDMIESNMRASWAGAISGWIGAMVAIIALAALILLAT